MLYTPTFQNTIFNLINKTYMSTIYGLEGVPQGLNLNKLLFLVFINNLFTKFRSIYFLRII